MMMVGILGDLIISAVSEPKTAVSSSSTILIICCAGLSVSMTSCPTARSRTFLIKSFTTGKATSASSKAKRISLVASWTSDSEIFPFLRRFLKTFCKRSVKLSNAIFLPLILYYQCLLKFLSAPAESYPWDSAPKSDQKSDCGQYSPSTCAISSHNLPESFLFA
ncbi:Uncharacterised protein [Streptococcus pneumoniae]|nr:Uncharacterised protein [Streptococcus pneumoniae]